MSPAGRCLCRQEGQATCSLPSTMEPPELPPRRKPKVDKEDAAEEVRSQRATRAMSVQSRAAVKAVESLKDRFEGLRDRLTRAVLVATADKSSLKDLLDVKLELAQIVGSLEKFQFNEVDAVETHNLSSGKNEVRQQRKELTRAVMALGDEAASIHKAVAARIETLNMALTPYEPRVGGGNITRT